MGVANCGAEADDDRSAYRQCSPTKGNHKMKSVTQPLALAVVAILAASACEEHKTGEKGNLPATAYVDPKGYFSMLPPSGWRVQEYPQDPRGKVAFTAPDADVDLRVLAKAVDIADYDGLIANLRDIEKQVAVPMNIEPVVFNGMPAIKREATLTMQGVTQKMLWIDLLIGGISYNIQYGAPPSLFDKYRDTAWHSMLTHQPLKGKNSSSPEEARRHDAAKWLRLAQIALEMGKTQAAKDAVSAGIEAEPGNAQLQKLRADLGIALPTSTKPNVNSVAREEKREEGGHH